MAHHIRLHEKVDEVSPQGGCDIRKALKRQRLSNAFYSAEGALKSYETAFVPVAQMGALSDAFFRRKYLFSVEESYHMISCALHSKKEPPCGGSFQTCENQAFLAISVSWVKAAASLTASSASILRLISMPATFRPCMKVE